MMEPRIEILGLGVASVDDLLVIPHFPHANDKQKILSKTRQCGGLTATALVAAARLGCRCGLVISLGEGELAELVRRELTREGISLLERADCPEAEPHHSYILIEEKTGERGILSESGKVRPPLVGKLELALAKKVGCLVVDHVFAEHVLEAVKTARQAGTPVVGDFERTTPSSGELMDMTDHLILPLSYARQLLGESATAATAAKTFARRPGRTLACVTDGVRGCWYALGEHPDMVSHQPAFQVERVADSTGCGDVFHGVYAAGIVRGWTPAERIRRAAAAAAMKAGKPGAQAGAPTITRLETFLHDSPPLEE